VQSLLLIFIAHATLRFPRDDPWSASIVSAFLLLCMAFVARFGGWKSGSGAWRWLKSVPGFFFLVLSAPVLALASAAVAGLAIPFNHLLAYAIESFFFAYAFIAVLRAFWLTGLASIASWFRT
jgi:hypothetical protein